MEADKGHILYYDISDLEKSADNIPYIVWVKDQNNVYRYINKEFASFVGLKREDIIGKDDQDCLSDEISKKFKTDDRRIFKKECSDFEQKTVLVNGEERYYELYRMPVKNQRTGEKFILGLGRKITLDGNIEYEFEKKIVKNSLENYNKPDDKTVEKNMAEEIVKSLLNKLSASSVSIYLYNDTTEYFESYITAGLNFQTEKVYLRLEEDVLRKFRDTNIYNVIHKISEKSISNTLLRGKVKEEVYKGYVKTYAIKYQHTLIGMLSIYYIKKAKVNYKQEYFIRSMCDKIGMLIRNRMLTYQLNVELEKRAESEKEVELFLEIAADFCAVVTYENGELKFKQISQKWNSILGWEKSELLSSDLRSFVHKDDIQVINSIIINYENFKSGNSVRIRCKCKNGGYHIIEWNWKYQGKGITIITGKDRTEQEKLKNDNKRLEDAIALESLKTEFFTNMSHEFKTPLNIILTTAQLMKMYVEDCSSAERRDKLYSYIKGVKQNSYRLLRLVNNMIDVSKIEGGYYELKLGNYNVVSIIEEIVLSVVQYIDSKGKVITFDTDEEEIIIACDPDKIERIILNLLSNSLKYANKNIQVNIKLNEDKTSILVYVKNDGSPISREEAERVFERFVQLEQDSSKNRCGSGIGLSLVRSLVEMHGGHIWVDTETKQGTCFVFSLPIKQVEEDDEEKIYSREISSRIEKCNIEFSDIYEI